MTARPSTLPAPEPAAAEPARTLFRARVITANSTAAKVELSSGEPASAALAFTFPYAPQPGDRLLVLATPAGHRAIGLLSGAGAHTLGFQGDVELRTHGGPLRLEASERLELDAPRVTLGAGRLRTFAERLKTQADDVYEWVQDLLDLRADESRRAIEGEDYAQAESVTVLAQETLKVDGSSVQLG